MARRNNSNPKTDPDGLTLRVWVIEARRKDFTGGAYSFGWRCHDILTGATEADAVFRCNLLAESRITSNYRYRAATLTFDDDGRKCTIY